MLTAEVSIAGSYQKVFKYFSMVIKVESTNPFPVANQTIVWLTITSCLSLFNVQRLKVERYIQNFPMFTAKQKS